MSRRPPRPPEAQLKPRWGAAAPLSHTAYALPAAHTETKAGTSPARPQPGTPHRRRLPKRAGQPPQGRGAQPPARPPWLGTSPGRPPGLTMAAAPRRRAATQDLPAGTGGARAGLGRAAPLSRLTGLGPPPAPPRRTAPPSLPRGARLPGGHYVWGRKAGSRAGRRGRCGRLFGPLRPSSVTGGRCGPFRLAVALTETAKQAICPRQIWQTWQQKPARCFRPSYSCDWPVARVATPFSQPQWRKPGMGWAARSICSARAGRPLYHWLAHREAKTNGKRRWFGAQFEWGRPVAAAVSSPFPRRSRAAAMFISDCRREFYDVVVSQVRAAGCDPWAVAGEGAVSPGVPVAELSAPLRPLPAGLGGPRRLTERGRCRGVPGSWGGGWGASVPFGPRGCGGRGARVSFYFFLYTFLTIVLFAQTVNPLFCLWGFSCSLS